MSYGLLIDAAVDIVEQSNRQFSGVVTITLEVSSKSVNRAIIIELLILYKESVLGSRLSAYDGWKSLYTAGELPFTWKEFAVKIFDEDDGIISGPR
ncbi:unnamed protein product [Brassica rapa]|uniref:Protein argonaute N-terminal domain-containing protein n=1 Tax=Brassica campestris TaxID=3711 RepID=A0A8D9GWQ4_BRACM|nr:unnamed protein product [Brassica rapa]